MIKVFKKHEKRVRTDLHYLNPEGMVACNPRDREASHRADVESIATDNKKAVTCKKCLLLIYKNRFR